MKGPCRWCKGSVTGRRRTFCSDACVHEWRLRSSTSYLRECVLERDRGICASCGTDTVRARRRVMRLPFARRMSELRALLERGVIHRRRKSWWEADHIVPVVEGGDSNLENLRTLCIPCHRSETRALRARYTRTMRSKVAEEVRKEQEDEVLSLTPEERLDLAFRLGEDDLAIFMASAELDRDEALRVLRRNAQAERPHPSRSKGE